MGIVSGSHGPKRTDQHSLEEIQRRNEAWWENSPMDYQWRKSGEPARPVLSAAWFEDQDRRFIEASRHFATEHIPFDRLIPYDRLRGKHVLEIGTGAGLHAELLARSGAVVSGIDLTRSAIERTRRRFELKGLRGEFEQWDAEQQRPEYRGAFDFVWSWGVIHHSSRTALIVRNIHEWLKPDGQFAGMVYHRDSTTAVIALLTDWLVKRNLFTHSVDEALWRITDGFSARFYPAEQWRDLLLAFFNNASVAVTGSLTDALPLPSRIRSALLPYVPDRTRDRLLSRVGSFVTFEATGPRAG
jgi:2-polyprenyl-3-methyl-5-hydroxy-6-metoxy-1,4-benzoquinol methylase